MLNKFSWKELVVLLIALLPGVYLYHIYPSLPPTIPTHFGLSGKPDGYGGKETLIYTTVLLAGLALGLYLLIKFLPSIDPKKTAGLSATTFQKSAVGLVIFLTAINILTMYASVAGSFNFTRLLFPLMGLFFIYIGNLMHSLKPNYFVGIRLPWTREDPDNWRVTHQLGGKLWVAGGLAVTFCTLVLPARTGGILFLILISLMVIIPVVYSYRYFKKTNQPK